MPPSQQASALRVKLELLNQDVYLNDTLLDVQSNSSASPGKPPFDHRYLYVTMCSVLLMLTGIYAVIRYTLSTPDGPLEEVTKSSHTESTKSVKVKKDNKEVFKIKYFEALNQMDKGNVYYSKFYKVDNENTDQNDAPTISDVSTIITNKIS